MSAAMVTDGSSNDRAFTDYFSGVSLGARETRPVNLSGGRRPVYVQPT
jgi:hypothetical protein